MYEIFCMKDNPNALKCQRKSFNPPLAEPAILNYGPCASD